MLPTELLALMGMPLRLCRFRDLVAAGVPTAADLRRCCGNGLHCPSVTAAFLWAVANVDV